MIDKDIQEISYTAFMKQLRNAKVVEYEVIPLIKEYWFDEPTKVRDWSATLRSAIK